MTPYIGQNVRRLVVREMAGFEAAIFAARLVNLTPQQSFLGEAHIYVTTRSN